MPLGFGRDPQRQTVVRTSLGLAKATVRRRPRRRGRDSRGFDEFVTTTTSLFVVWYLTLNHFFIHNTRYHTLDTSQIINNMRRAAGSVCAPPPRSSSPPPRALGVSSSSSFSRKDNSDDSNADATTTDTKVSSAHHHHHLKADFRYAAALLRQRDYETYLCTCAVDASKRAVPLALRALNCETVIDVVHENDGNAALMKLKWWHDPDG